MKTGNILRQGHAVKQFLAMQDWLHTRGAEIGRLLQAEHYIRGTIATRSPHSYIDMITNGYVTLVLGLNGEDGGAVKIKVPSIFFDDGVEPAAVREWIVQENDNYEQLLAEQQANQAAQESAAEKALLLKLMEKYGIAR